MRGQTPEKQFRTGCKIKNATTNAHIDHPTFVPLYTTTPVPPSACCWLKRLTTAGFGVVQADRGVAGHLLCTTVRKKKPLYYNATRSGPARKPQNSHNRRDTDGPNETVGWTADGWVHAPLTRMILRRQKYSASAGIRGICRYIAERATETIDNRKRRGESGAGEVRGQKKEKTDEQY